jgi:Tfp pilus assembly protein PilO
MTKKLPKPAVYIALTAASLVVGGGLTYWQWGTMQDLSSKAQAARVEVGSRVELERQLKQAQEELLAAAADLQHLESTVTTVEYIPTMLQDLQKTGESCHLDILGVRPMPVVEKPKKVNDGDEEPEEKIQRKPYQELDVEVKSKGSFSQLMTFLKKLETFPKIVGVRSLNLSPKVGLDAKSLDAIEATIRVRVYVFPAKKNSAPGNASPLSADASTRGGAQ